MSPEETETVVHGAAHGANAAANTTHQNAEAIAKAINSSVSSEAEDLGLDPDSMAGAAKAGTADTDECMGCPPPPEPKVAPEILPPEPVEPEPDPIASKT